MRLFDRCKNLLVGTLLKDETSEERTFFALTILTGIAAGVIASLTHAIVETLTNFFGTNKSFDLHALLWGGGALLFSSYLTWRHFPSTSGSGVSGIKVAITVFNGKISIKDTIAKFVTSIFSLSSGLSIGPEGPMVTVNAGVGAWLGHFFSLSKARIKALVAVGAAGGIAAAFHTPIAAVIFTLEEVVGNLNATKLLGPVIIASVASSITAQMLHGEQVQLFSQLNYRFTDTRELALYLLIGVLSAVLGSLFISAIVKMREFNVKVFKHHKLTPTLLIFLIIAFISLFYPRVIGIGNSTIEEALRSLLLDWRLLLILFSLKFFATVISYSTGVSAGLYMPTLLMGAILGAFVGSAGANILPVAADHIGAYALVGMGAFLVAVIRVPFTALIMVFELTRDYSIVLPLMIANTTSYLLANGLLEGSISEKLAEQDGIHLPGKEDHEILNTLVVEDAMVTEPITLNTTLTAKEAWEGVKDYDFSGYPLVRNGLLDGMISTNQLRAMIMKGEGDKRIQDIAERKIISIHPDQSLLIALHKLDRFQVSRLPVVSRLNDKRLIGIITAEDIVSQFGYHIKEEEKQEQLEKAVRDVIEEQREEHTIKT